MKFIDNILNRLIDKKFSRIESRINLLEKVVNFNRSTSIDSMNSLKTDSLKMEIDLCKLVKDTVDTNFSALSHRLDMVNSKVIVEEDELRKIKEDLEISLDGIIKIFEQKLEVLGYKKIIATDLLKKLAKLEAKDVLT